MRTVTIQKVVRKFDELDDKLRALVLSNNSDINIDYEWWESTVEDAKNAGLTITAFSVDGHRADFISAALIQRSHRLKKSITQILADHGETCDTHRLATEYQAKLKAIAELIEVSDYEKLEEAYNDLDALENEYGRELGKLYLDMLRREYEGLCSDEGIAETLKANDYEFDEKGNIWRYEE